MNSKSIFLDRDGVINKETNYLFEINDFEFIDGVFDACKYFQNIGYKIVIVTNQSGIARGLYSHEDFKRLTKWMCLEFKKNKIDILDVFYCPHLPEDLCNCRKPRPGMLIEAKEKHKIDLQNSWFIGDKEIDITAANAAGVSKTILVRSGHKIDSINSKANYILDSIKDSINVIF